MVGLALNTADAMGEIDDMAQRTGVTAEEFQKYAYAAKLSGMETATLESAMIKAQKSFADASEGGKTASEAFSKLGLDVSNMTSDGAFDAAIMALADIEDTTERNAIANDIFGKSYAELAPMLNSGAEGIKALKDEAVAMGGVMSNDSVAAGAEFGDMLDKTKTAMGGVFNELGLALMPMLTEFLNWVIVNMPEIKETFSTVFGGIATVVGGVWEVFSVSLLPILKGLWEWIEPNMPLIQSAVESAFKGISDIVGGVTEVFSGLVDGIKIAIEWLHSFDEEDKRGEDFDFSQNVNKGESIKKGSRATGKKQLNGSHASGLAYVPFDGYVAETHKGEEIVKAQDKQSIVDLIKMLTLNNNNKSQNSQKVELIVNLDGRTLARGLYDPMQNENKLRGTSIAMGV